MQRCAGLLAVEKFGSGGGGSTSDSQQKTLLLADTVGVRARGGAGGAPLLLSRSLDHPFVSQIRAANSFLLKTVSPSQCGGSATFFTVNADASGVNGSEACWRRCRDFSPDGAGNVAELMRAVNNVGVCVCVFF